MTLGGQVIGFIECLKVPEGALVGQLIKLDDFQKKFILMNVGFCLKWFL